MWIPEQRCERTDLLMGMCGCQDCRPDLNVPQNANEAGGTVIESRFLSRCPACHRTIHQGDRIKHDDAINGWVHEDCDES